MFTSSMVCEIVCLCPSPQSILTILLHTCTCKWKSPPATLCTTYFPTHFLACVQTITKLWLVQSVKQRRDPCSGPQPTQRITRSAFRISLQPDWLLSVLRQTKQRSFLTGQSWCVLKSGDTAGSPEQGFQRCFADGVNQSLISSAHRLPTSGRA